MSWVLSSDLIGLAGMPTTSRGITKKATTENWIKRRRKGVKGNVFEYQISSMPTEIQAAIAAKLAEQTLKDAPTLPAEVKPPVKVSKKSQQLGLIPIEQGLQHLDDKQRAVADARLALVSYVLSLHRCEQLKLGIKESVRYVVEQIELGTLPNDKMHFVSIANARTGKKQQGLSFPTLYRWVRAYRAVQGDGESLRMSAILVGGYQRSSGKLFVVEAQIKKRLPDLIIEDVIRLHQQYRCQLWLVETVQFQEFLKDELVKRSAQRGCPVPARPVKPNSDKMLRACVCSSNICAIGKVFSPKRKMKHWQHLNLHLL